VIGGKVVIRFLLNSGFSNADAIWLADEQVKTVEFVD
jgi:hypothetical protein